MTYNLTDSSNLSFPNDEAWLNSLLADSSGTTSSKCVVVTQQKNLGEPNAANSGVNVLPVNPSPSTTQAIINGTHSAAADSLNYLELPSLPNGGVATVLRTNPKLFKALLNSNLLEDVASIPTRSVSYP